MGLIEDTPEEMKDNVRRLSDSFGHPYHDYPDTEIEWIVEGLELEAMEILEQHGVPSNPSDLRWIDENTMVPPPAINARGVVLRAQSFRFALEREDVADASLNIMLLTLAAVRYHAGLGVAQHEGSKKGRQDALGRLAEQTFIALATQNGVLPSTKQVISHLQDYDTADGFKQTIQEIDCKGEVIHWIDRRGREKKTGFKRFGDRVANFRKRVRYTSPDDSAGP